MKVSLETVIKLFVDLGFSTAPRWSIERLKRKIDGLPDVIDEDTDAGESQELLDDLLVALDNEDEIVILETEEAEDPKPKKKKKKAVVVAEEEPEPEPEPEPEEEEEPEPEPEEEEEPAAVEVPEWMEDREPEASFYNMGKVPEAYGVEALRKLVESRSNEVIELMQKVAELKAEVERLKKQKPSSNGKPKKKKKKTGVISSIIDLLNEATKENPISKEGLHKCLVEKFPDRSYAGMMATVSSQVPSRLISDKGLEVEKSANGFWIE